LIEKYNNFKIGKRPKHIFLRRRDTNSQQVYEKILNITSHQGNANHNHNISALLLGWLLTKRQVLAREKRNLHTVVD
jgi:hypothetical protein